MDDVISKQDAGKSALCNVCMTSCNTHTPHDPVCV